MSRANPFAPTALEGRSLGAEKVARLGFLVVFVVGVGVFVVVSIVFFSWIYNRNEPKWMTPVIEKIAPFFPSAGSYQDKQRSP